MRISLLLLALACSPCLAQIPDDSENTGGTPPPRAQPVSSQNGPAAQQSAENDREKILKAADQLDLIQSNAETTKEAVDNMKADITRLQSANTDLTQQVSDLRAALDKAEAERTKERQVLVDEVAQLVASRNSETTHVRHHVDELQQSNDMHESAGTPPPPDTEVHHASATALSPPADPAPSPAPKPKKGYYHVVESGETLTMICQAYRDQGVNVSLAQVRRANGLTAKSKLRIGQKLFIPKPT